MSKFFKILTIACVVRALVVAAPASAQLIELDGLQIERLGIETETLEISKSRAVAELPATVIPAQDSLTNVTAPFEGVVSHVHVLPGQQVKEGDPIVTLFSRDYSEKLSDLEQASAEVVLAEQVKARQRALVEAGVAARATLEQAEAYARAARAIVREHRRVLALAGQDVTADVTGRSDYTVRAPADGQITRIRVSVGDTVASVVSLATLTSESGFWAQVQTPARIIGQIQIGDGLVFEDGSRGEVLSVSRVIDPQTRSGVVLASVPEQAHYFAGQFTQVRLVRFEQAGDALQASSSAIVSVDAEDFVFRVARGGFEAVPVTVLARAADRVVIAGSLEVGDRVATRGLSELKTLAIEEMN